MSQSYPVKKMLRAIMKQNRFKNKDLADILGKKNNTISTMINEGSIKARNLLLLIDKTNTSVIIGRGVITVQTESPQTGQVESETINF